ncbi:hypothetical protein Trydic_g12290 [Trypoxylus dichotomus]
MKAVFGLSPHTKVHANLLDLKLWRQKFLRSRSFLYQHTTKLKRIRQKSLKIFISERCLLNQALYAMQLFTRKMAPQWLCDGCRLIRQQEK